MIINVEEVRARIAPNRSAVWVFGPLDALVGIQLMLNLDADGPLNFAIFSAEQYSKFPETPSTLQWVGTNLHVAPLMRGSGPWYFVVANATSQFVDVHGTLGHGRA